MAKMIYRRLEVYPFGTNCYIVGSNQTRDGMVIDPAGQGDRILKDIKELGLKVHLIVATHTHPDHTGAVMPVKEATGAEFAVHAAEAGALQLYDYSQFFVYDPSLKPPPPPDRLLREGDTIKIGDLGFSVIHTPGHSAGGICLAGHGVVFSGDALFQMSIGRTDGPDGDYNLLISGIKNKLLVLPEDTLVLPGHGPKSSIGQEKRGNPFLQ